MLYLVSYDLNRPNGESAYPKLINQLQADGAIRILYSEWLVESTLNAKGVADHYLTFMDNNDGIFVTEVTTNTAWKNLQNDGQSDFKLFSVRRYAA